MQQPMTVVRASTPDELLGALSYTMVIRPQDNDLIVLGLVGQRVEVAGRMDMDQSTPDSVRGAVRLIEQRVPGAEFGFVAYGRPDVAWTALATAQAAYPQPVLLLAVDGDRWRQGSPDGPSGIVGDATRAAAVLVAAGVPPAPTRADVENSLRAPDGDALAQAVRMGAAYGDRAEAMTAQQQEQVMDEMLGRALSGTAGPETMTAMAVLLAFPAARDRAMLRLEPANAPEHVAAWTKVVGHAPPAARPHVLTQIALAAWVGGDGLRSNLVLRRMDADGLAPTGMSALLRTAAKTGMKGPDVWPTVRESMTAGRPSPERVVSARGGAPEHQPSVSRSHARASSPGL